MKQIVILIAMLVLGIGIGSLVMGLSTQAEAVKDVGVSSITSFVTDAAPTGN